MRVSFYFAVLCPPAVSSAVVTSPFCATVQLSEAGHHLPSHVSRWMQLSVEKLLSSSAPPPKKKLTLWVSVKKFTIHSNRDLQYLPVQSHLWEACSRAPAAPVMTAPEEGEAWWCWVTRALNGVKTNIITECIALCHLTHHTSTDWSVLQSAILCRLTVLKCFQWMLGYFSVSIIHQTDIDSNL